MPEYSQRRGEAMPPAEKQMRRDLRKREVLAQCRACGGPLWNAKSARLGYGEYCLRKAVEEGRVRVENGVVVPTGSGTNEGRSGGGTEAVQPPV